MSGVSQIAENDVVWRYMTFGSLVAILHESKLHFTQLSKLASSDRYEGPVYDDERLTFDGLNRSLDLLEKGRNEEAAKETAASDFFSCTFVNCWHCSPAESFAMWKIYGLADGVAVRSTVARLKSSFASPDVRVGRVQYQLERPSQADERALWKRPCFEYEREVRAVVTVPKPDPSLAAERREEVWQCYRRGFRLEGVQLTKLVDAVFV